MTRRAICDGKCGTEEVMDREASSLYILPKDWTKITIQSHGSYLYGTASLDFCPACTERVLPKKENTFEERQQGLENFLREYIREEVELAMDPE